MGTISIMGAEGDGNPPPDATLSTAPLSIVIPTLEAAATLGAALAALDEGRASGLVREVIVVDGGSSDATRAVADAAGAELATAPRGRGAQLAAGAQRARGDWLLFLHADTRLEAGWAAAVRGFIDQHASSPACGGRQGGG